MMSPSVEAYETSGGAKIYRIPLELFPNLTGYAHLVIADGIKALVDVGSGFSDSNEQLSEGFNAVQTEHGEAIDWGDLTHVLISHGHIDHFGGLHFVRELTDAPIGIHELDLRVLSQYEDRVTIVAGRMKSFLEESGVDNAKREELMSLYLLNKHLFSSIEVEFTFEAHAMQVGSIQLMHVPGHCPGQVVFRIDDVLLSADHILKQTSPHQAPERLTLNMGLGHYLRSLRNVRQLAGSTRVTLGGHEPVIEDLGERISQLELEHQDRLNLTLEVLKEPKTVAQVSETLFPETEGYHQLLAIEETAAHIEYLSLRGYLRILNLEELEEIESATVIYQRRDDQRTMVPDLDSGNRVQA